MPTHDHREVDVRQGDVVLGWLPANSGQQSVQQRETYVVTSTRSLSISLWDMDATQGVVCGLGLAHDANRVEESFPPM